MSDEIVPFDVSLTRGFALDGEMATRDIVDGAIIRSCAQDLELTRIIDLEVEL